MNDRVSNGAPSGVSTSLARLFRALPDADHVYGVTNLGDDRRPLSTDAAYFPTMEDARAWAVSRGWLVYELKQVVGL